MAIRKVIKQVQGFNTVDGAGVHLVRVLGAQTAEDFDPFLMLDSFDSHNPSDYIKGFPTHPHRGIETITYLIKGNIEHEDSLGNKGRILSGQSQWMTAGSGIMHQEMPQASEHMLGLQIWLNLPQKDKMSNPAYFDITQEQIAMVEEDCGTVRVISGAYQDALGVKPKYVQATLYDVELLPGQEIVIDTKPDENVFIFTILGDVSSSGTYVAAKTAALFGPGDALTVKAAEQAGSRFIFFSGKPLHEPIASGGPIVMNSQKELIQAFQELRDNTFIKVNAKQ